MLVRAMNINVIMNTFMLLISDYNVFKVPSLTMRLAQGFWL